MTRLTTGQLYIRAVRWVTFLAAASVITEINITQPLLTPNKALSTRLAFRAHEPGQTQRRGPQRTFPSHHPAPSIHPKAMSVNELPHLKPKRAKICGFTAGRRFFTLPPRTAPLGAVAAVASAQGGSAGGQGGRPRRGRAEGRMKRERRSAGPAAAAAILPVGPSPDLELQERPGGVGHTQLLSRQPALLRRASRSRR